MLPEPLGLGLPVQRVRPLALLPAPHLAPEADRHRPAPGQPLLQRPYPVRPRHQVPAVQEDPQPVRPQAMRQRLDRHMVVRAVTQEHVELHGVGLRRWCGFGIVGEIQRRLLRPKVTHSVTISITVDVLRAGT